MRGFWSWATAGARAYKLALALIAALAVCEGRAQAELSFTIGGTWDSQSRKDAATAAMQAVVDRYNTYAPTGFDNRNIWVYYDAGIPTAQASYHGSIGFGGTWPNERVTQHELAHYLGLPSTNWSGLMSGGSWSGAQGDALVRQLDGDQATLNGDSIHFWPYGLNYDSEGSAVNKQRQVAVVYAMRADLGIGPRAHPSTATTVTLSASDPAGESGFNYNTRWSDGYFAHAGAAYRTGAYVLRTPASANSFTFAGDSLTLDNPAEGTGLWYRGQGTAGVVTIDDLILDGGWVDHRSSGGLADLFQLDGQVTVSSASTIRAYSGNIDVLADVSGGGDLTIATASNPTEDNRYVRFLSANNSFVGDIINESRFELAESANFTFAIGAAGVNNAISGAAARNTLLNGVFDLDLSGASAGAGDSWALVTAANATYGPEFNVAGFTGANDVWSNGTYTFSQATGLLTLVTSWATDGGGAWSNQANWTGGVPASGGDATLGSVLTAPHAAATVNLDVPVTLGRLTFDNANRYVIAGANSLTLTGNALVVANSGSHEIAVPVGGTAGLNVRGGGTVTLAAANGYSGDTNVDTGTLALKGTATIANSSHINVQPGATFDVSGLATAFEVAGGQSLNNNASVVGNVTAASGSVVAGTGTFSNHLEMQSGSVLRIGGAGISVQSAPLLIDNFDSYNNTVNQNIGAHSSGDVTRGRWDGVFDGTGNAVVVDDADPSDNSLRVNGISYQSDRWRGAVTNLAISPRADRSLADGAQATYFFQFRREGSGDIDGIIGLADSAAAIDTASPWNDYAVLAGVYGTSPQDTDLRAYSEGLGDVVVLENISNETWYNVWLVVDNLNKTFDIYTSTGTDDADPNDPSTYRTGLNFGRDVDVTSLTQLGLNEGLSDNDPSDAALRVDNLYRAPGVNMANPLAVGGGILYSPEVLSVLGDVELQAGATVALDIAASGVNDRLDIGGSLVAAGTLAVLHAGTAPALGLGDSYDLFDFANASGMFDEFDLPVLGADLRWDISNLTVDGSIAVVAGLDGDFNGDGVVDAADYTVWRDHLGEAEDAVVLAGNGTEDNVVDDADYALWKANFGATLGTGSLTLQHTSAVPEPTSLVLGCLAMAGLGWLRRRAG